MSDIYFKCECGKSLAVDEAGLGRAVCCVDCGKPVVVPEPDFAFSCPNCGAMLLAPDSIAGDLIKCAACGHRLTIPPMTESEGRARPPGAPFLGLNDDASAFCRIIDEPCNDSVTSAPSVVMASLMRRSTGGAYCATKFTSRRRPPRRSMFADPKLPGRLFRAAVAALALVALAEAMRGFLKDGGSARDEFNEMGTFQQTEAIRSAELAACPGAVAHAEIGSGSDSKSEEELPDRKRHDLAAASGASGLSRDAQVALHPGIVSRPDPCPVADLDVNLPALRQMEPGSGEPAELAEKRAVLEEDVVPGPPDFSGLSAELFPYVQKADALGAASGAAEKLREARAKLLESIRRYGQSDRLDLAKWVSPMRTCYEWSFDYGLLNHAEAAAAAREALAALKIVSPSNAEAAARAASSIGLMYAERWMDTHAPESMMLADEIEEWVLQQPGGKEAWYWPTRYTQGNFILQEKQFPEDQRAWLWEGRQARLRSRIDEGVMGLPQRTDTLVHWCKVLYLTGHGGEACALMTEWTRKHGRVVQSARLLEWRMRLALFEKADWEAAGNVLAEANLQRDIWERRPSEQRSYAALSEMFYNCMNLAEYELKRARSIEKKMPFQRRDPLRTISGGMY